MYYIYYIFNEIYTILCIQYYTVEEVKNYSMNLLKIFMSLLLVLRFVQSSDDN